MLQRAASNAYTWWWASNIRSKQSKWLDNDLQEMEERVKSMVKLIEEDGDSFAKKAEMYYKRRPELISRVEETFKAYKALADRYDRISGELHKANHTIATVLPDQVQFMEDEDDDRPPPKEMPSANSNKFMSMSPPPDSIKLPKPPPPDLPRMLPRGLASDPQQATKKMHHVRVASFQEIPENVKEEIDKLHKGILILQTEKEFFKGMYERGLTKYWDIERQMTEMQEEVTRLQDEFGASNMIEDDEARALIAATALKSCEDTLITLREQQKRTVEEARLESQRIKEASHKLNALKGGEGGGEEGSEDAADRHVSSGSSAVEEEIESLKNERLELQSVCAKVKEHFELCSDSSVVELAEKIDELVDKVISLEVIVSSLTAQIERLRSETDELHKYLRGLEEEKASPAWDSDSMNDRLKQAEQDLQRIQKLERSVHQDKRVLRIQLCQVCHSLNDLSEKLQSPRQTEKPSAAEDDDDDDEAKRSNLDVENVDKTQGGEKKLIKSQECLTEEGEGDRDWERLLMNGFEGNEKVLLLKCASIIRNYKETKMMLTEIDKKNQECHSETMQQIQELRNANAVKDEEIRALRQRLFSSESWRARGGSMKKAAAPQHVQKLEELVANPDSEMGASDELAREVVKICHAGQSTSAIEDKFRADIDTLLEENLDFWLRFSTSYHQIQKFESKFKELEAEIEKAREAKNSSVDDNISLEEAMKQNKIPTDKKLRELNTELQVWLEQNGLLQGELRSRFSSLCSIQEEIARASEEENEQFTRYQAAKFQGEVINMQQENSKVAKELETGLEHVRGLQVQVGRALSLLHQSFDLSVASKRSHHHPVGHPLRHLSTKSRIPLRTFLFGVKPKKPSLFSCMNPVYQKHHSDTRHATGLHK